MPPLKTIDPLEYIDNLGSQEDARIDLGVAALALGALDQPGISLERFINHLKAIGFDVAERHLALLKEGATDDALTQLAALKHTISDSYAYLGDGEHYDDLENASLTRLIDKGKGGSVALGILYIHAGRAQGWDMDGLKLPGRFICRVQKDGRRVLFDPFAGCQLVGAPEMRSLVKAHIGPEAELLAEYSDVAGNRDVLIRLQNAIKFKKIEGEDYQGALEVVERMRKIDPQEYRLLLDAGVLYAKLEQPKKAINTLNEYITVTPDMQGRREAELLLYHLHDTLN